MNAPKGLRVRAPRLDDFDDVLAVMNAHEGIYGPEARSLPDDLRETWSRPSFDLARDAWVVVTVRGRIVAYMEVRDLDKARAESDGYVHPDFEGRGIGSLLLRLAEDRVRSVEARLEISQQRDLMGGIFANNLAGVQLFEARGFHWVRYFLHEEIHFDSVPPAPVWPNGVTVRSFRQGEAIAPIYEMVEEAFKDHWGERERSLEEWAHIWQAGNMDPTLWFIAESGGTIAGVSLCRMRDDAGHVQTLGVRRAFRRNGLGLALLRHSFSEFHRRNVRTVRLDVDAKNLTGATRLYQRAGMREVRRFALYRKEL